MDACPETISVRMIEEYTYCPMLIYYKYVLGIRRQPSLWSNVGLQIQDELSSYVEERYRVIDRQVRLESRALGIVGVVDYIVEYSNMPVPLEIKYSWRLKPWWKYTLVAYTVLLEENMGKPVKTAILVLPGPKTIFLNIRENDREYLMRTVHTIRMIIGEGKQPRPRPSRTCRSCDYRDLCLTTTKYS